MKLVFIIGTGRCGSTFVHEILARHPDIGFISNIEDNFPNVNTFGRWNNSLYQSPLGRFTRKSGLRFAPSEAYKLISREVSPIYANSCRDLGAQDVTPWLESRFRRFFQDRFLAQGKSIFSHKYTGWPRIEFFAKIFPDAKFIHIIRDGRAVANSWLQMPWWGGYRGTENWLWGKLSPEDDDVWKSSGQDFSILAALSWKILMEAFITSEKGLPHENYMRLRLEDVLDEPEEYFQRMIEFCGVSHSGDFLKRAANQRILKDRSLAYIQDLSPRQLDSMEMILRPMLDLYGYR
jgi:hypothetical protein